MTNNELREILSRLSLSQTEAGQLLGVAARSVRRWMEGEEVPGPVEQALRAWAKLHDRSLSWRPDSVSIFRDDQDQIARSRAHAIELNAMLSRVEARGGSNLPWIVDRKRRCAVLGPMEVSYYDLANGSFSLSQYTRKDRAPDVQRDQELIEEAAFCIAKEITRHAAITVTLGYMDGPHFQNPNKQLAQTSVEKEEYSSNDAAIQRACELMQSQNYHSFFIRKGKSLDRGEILWDEVGLRRECSRRKKTMAA